MLELGHLGSDHELAVALVGIAGKIFLVIFLGGVEDFKRHELGDNGVEVQLFISQLSHDFLSLRFLLIVGVEDGGAILGADIRALAVKRGRVVDSEKDVQKVGIRYDCGVECDLYGLGMTCSAAADLFIAGMWAFTARVA